MRLRAFAFTVCLLCCLPILGQTVYNEIPLPPSVAASGQRGSRVTVDSDGAVWMFYYSPTGLGGTIFTYNPSTPSAGITSVGKIDGTPLGKSITAKYPDGYHVVYQTFGPQGSKGLFAGIGTTTNIVVYQAKSTPTGFAVATYCSDYTVDGKTGGLQNLRDGVFASYDDEYYAIGNIATGDTSTSTVFALGKATGTTCDLKTVTKVPMELIQIIKTGAKTFLAESLLSATPSAITDDTKMTTEVGELSVDGTYVPRYGRSTGAQRCCTLVAGDVSKSGQDALVTYIAKDGTGTAVLYRDSAYNPVFNSKTAGMIPSNIKGVALKGDRAILEGGSYPYYVDTAVAVDMEKGNFFPFAALAASADIPGFAANQGILPSTAMDLDAEGAIYFDGLNQHVNKEHFLTAMITGFTDPPMPEVTDFSANTTEVAPGGSVALTWRTKNGATVTIQGYGPVDPQGTLTVSPAVSTRYTLTVTNASGIATATVMVEVVKESSGRKLPPPLHAPLPHPHPLGGRGN